MGTGSDPSDYVIHRDNKGIFHVLPGDMNEAFRQPMGPGMGGFGPPPVWLAMEKADLKEAIHPEKASVHLTVSDLHQALVLHAAAVHVVALVKLKV